MVLLVRLSARSLLAAVLFATLLLGCATQGAVSVADWSLECQGCTTRPVHLPGNVRGIPASTPSYVLRSDVALPAAMQGQELTLVLPAIYTLGTLRAGDATLEPLERRSIDRVRPSDMQLVFRVPAAQTARERLPLALTLEIHDPFVSCQVGDVPRLVLGAYGDRGAIVARDFNRSSTTAMLVIGVMLGVACGALFLFDRRRASDGWFAVVAFGLVLWNAAAHGLSQLVSSADVLSFPAVGTALICVAAPGFCGAHFERRVSRAVVGALVALSVVVCTLAVASAYAAEVAVMAMQIVVLVAYLGWFLGPLALRGPRRLDAAVMLWCWVLAAAAAVETPLRQVHLTPLAWILFLLAHTTLLARTHTRTLRGTAAELADRVTRLEQANRDVAALNDELRRQVGDRSARLVEALALAGPLSAPPSRLRPGAALGDRYQVVRQLGEGGMGTVYEVERTTDGRRFALKTVTSPHGGVALARLAREAQVATKVVHPNVVAVVDVDVSPAGMLYVVMELIVGKPLAAESERYGDAAWALPVLAQLAAGLRALHDAGIVHRDLKPANVLLETTDGAPRVKIADFGIARLASETPSLRTIVDPHGTTLDEGAGQSPLASSHPELTGTGILVGTPLYMAPELAGGSKDAMPSCDVWSFGVLAYQLATGRLPYEVPPVAEVAATGAWTRPPPDTRGLPPPLDTLVAACLDADASKRPDARQLELALAAP